MARGLWDSYEDGAFPADVARGVFLDPDKLHALDHVGEHFRVAGPLNLSRSPQGQPVIFQAGVSEEGRDLAARVAEGIYAPGGSLEQAQEYYADIKKRTAAYGRDPEHIKIFIHGGPVVAATDEKARRREREIFEEDNDLGRNLALLGRSFGAYDFSVHDLDAPFPNVAHLAEKGGRTAAAKIIDRAKAESLTLRQVAESVNAFRASPSSERRTPSPTRSSGGSTPAPSTASTSPSAPPRNSTSSSTESSPSSSAAACSAPPTRRTPCAATSACRYRPTATPRPVSGRTADLADPSRPAGGRSPPPRPPTEPSRAT